MPHKRNLLLTENLTGLARIVQSAVVPRPGECGHGTSVMFSTHPWSG